MLVRSAPQASSSVGRPRRVSRQRPCRQIELARIEEGAPSPVGVPNVEAAAGLDVVTCRGTRWGAGLSTNLDDVRQTLTVQIDAQSLQREVADLAAHRLQAFLADE